MLKHIKRFALSQAYKMALRKGVHCPHCGTLLQLPPSLPAAGLDASVHCSSRSHCGWQGTLLDLITEGGGTAPVVTEKPAKSKIHFSMGAEGQTWHIPAKLRPNFFWFFSLFWLSITGTFTVMILFADPLGVEKQGDFSPWLALFLLPFWAVGLGTLYAALRMTFASFKIIKSRGAIILRRHLLGVTSEQSLALNDLRKISLNTAYSQNNRPVYEIQIHAKEGKDIKFGSGLSNDEKSWLVYELKKLTGLDTNPSSSPTQVYQDSASFPSYDHAGGFAEIDLKAVSLKSTGGNNFTLRIKDTMAKWILLVGVFFAVFGGVFILVDLASLTDFDFSNDIMTILFHLFSCIGILIGSFAVLVSLVIITFAIKRLGTTAEFRFETTQLIHRTLKNGREIKSNSYDQSVFSAVTTSQSGHVNNSPRYQVKLTGQRSLKLCTFVEQDLASSISSWTRRWRDGNRTPNTTPDDTNDFHYGAPIELNRATKQR